MAIYKLSEEYDRIRFEKRIRSLYDNKKTVEVKELTGRTPKQNRYLHLIIGYLAIETGNTLEYVKTEYYKKASNKELYVTTVRDDILKCDNIVLRSSSKLSKEEMTLSIERFRNWGSQQGYYLPSADEKEIVQHIEIEYEKHKQYL